MHEDMTEMAAMLKPAFLLNAVFTPEGEFARFVAGHWNEARREGCRAVEEIFGVPIGLKPTLWWHRPAVIPRISTCIKAQKQLTTLFLLPNTVPLLRK